MDIAELARRSTLDNTEAAKEVDALIAREGADHSGSLDISGIRLDRMPDGIEELAWLNVLDCYYTRVSDLLPIRSLTALTKLDCSNTEVSDLSPLSSLTALTELSCAFTQVSDLSPIRSLTALTELNCSGTQVSDLVPIRSLTALTKLNCSSTQASDLSPISSLTALTELSCRFTAVSDLLPIRSLTALTKLNCSGTRVSDLLPIRSLTALTKLNCSGTRVSDLLPISSLTALTELDCSDTRVSDLLPISSLTALTELDCAYTPVSDLSPIRSVIVLTVLNCSGTQVSDLSPAINHPSLEFLNCARLPKCDVPPEQLSQPPYDNCLPRLRSHFANRRSGEEVFRRHKLFFLGNGTVGKTQLARQLRGLDFLPAQPSTHGIQLHDQLLPAQPLPGDAEPDDTFMARIWDFGGQDIYHGTHTLFLKTRAIFLICWESKSESEQQRFHEIGGQKFRNRPLTYWLDYVRTFAGPDAQVILVQTQCDKPGAPHVPPIDLARYSDLTFLTPCRTSAKSGRGIADLKEAIADAVGNLERSAIPRIATSERAVLDEIAKLRSASERTLTLEQFEALCAEAGIAGTPEHLLHFLHHAGEVFHSDGLFGNQIIIDQRWALDAIYAVFDRGETWQAIRAERGRFTLDMLAGTVWKNHSPADRKHLLGMMLECGMAFRYIEQADAAEKAIYIAPDLLPERGEEAVARWIRRYWDDDAPIRHGKIRFSLLHDGLMREIMAGIGQEAGLHAVYWKNGLLFHDSKTGAVAIIEAQWDAEDGWSGWIEISTQRRGAQDLLDALDAHVRKVCEKIGVSPEADADSLHAKARGSGLPTPHAAAAADTAERAPAFTPGAGKPLRPTCYVSYAWGNGTAQADANERQVDALCAAARERGIDIVRDKTHLASGASINAFSEEIARADRVVALIGERYWKRPDCFMELFGCWREAGLRAERFAGKMREFIFPDAGLFRDGLIAEIAAHWAGEHARCDQMPALERGRHETMLLEWADTWVPQTRKIVAALQDKVRTYEGDFAKFQQELFAELEALTHDEP